MNALNTVLELINGNLTIVRLAMMLGLLYYIVRQSVELGMTAKQWLFALPAELALASSFFLNDISEMARTSVVWFWRFTTGGTGSLSVSILIWLGAAGVVAVLSLLWAVRVVTRPWLGEGPWILTAIVCFVYTVTALLSK